MICVTRRTCSSSTRIAKSVFHLRGIERVQTITRPLGAPIEHSSIPFQIAMQNSGTLQTAKFMNDTMAQMLQQADELGKTIAVMEHMYGVMKELTATTHSLVGRTHEMVATTNELRDRIADFDDLFWPFEATSTGRDTVSTFPSAGLCGRSSMRSTVSTNSRTKSVGSLSISIIWIG